MKFGSHPEAELDVFDAATRLENARAGFGDKFFDATAQLWESIREYPLSFPRWEFRPRQRHLRFGVVRKFRYVVLFEVRHDAVFIYSVTHASRPPSAATRRIRDEKSKE